MFKKSPILYLTIISSIFLFVSLVTMLHVHAEEGDMIPTSRIPTGSNYGMNCEKVGDLPLNNNKVYRCENSEVVCYLTAPESQEQCRFK